MTQKPPLQLSDRPVFVVCQINGPSQLTYEGTEREFNDRTDAYEYMFESFSTMYGSEAMVEWVFWDPVHGNESMEIYTIEMFPAGDFEDGWYLYRKWEVAH